jgi:Ring finger domain
MPGHGRRCRCGLALLGAVVLSLAPAALAAAAGTADAAPADPPHSLPFPRNLHRVYDGTWEVAGSDASTPFTGVPLLRPRLPTDAETSAAGLATPVAVTAVRSLLDVGAPLGMTRGDAGGAEDPEVTRELAFDNRAGFALLTGENHESLLGKDINIVFGELLLRDGPYRSAHDVSLRLMGVYEWATGKLVVVGDVLYEDSTSALQRLYKVFASNHDTADLAALARRNITETGFVSALAPAFTKHRKQFRAQRSISGASTSSGVLPPPRRPTVAAYCPFAASISIVAGSYTDKLPGRSDLSSLASFQSGSPSNAGAEAGSTDNTGHKSIRFPGAVSSRFIRTAAGNRQLSAAAASSGTSSATMMEENTSTLEDGVIGGQDELVEMNGGFVSEECNTHLNILLSTLDTETLFGKAINYTLLVTFVAFMQVVVLIRQMEMTSTQAGASRVSLMTVGLQAVADSYLCLGHLTMGIAVPTLFNAFATAAFFKFIIFSIFEMRWLLLIWKARRPSGFAEGWEAMRRELSLLYSRFYGSLLLGIVILYQLQNHLKYFVFALYAFWLPQIVLNVVGDHRKPLHPMYILGMSVTRLMIPMYFYACPRNFLHIQPQYPTAIGLVVWVLTQASVLLSQHKYGSRWFVPKPLLPLKYDYFRPINTTSDVEAGCGAGEENSDESAALAEEGRSVFPDEMECCICMTSVEVSSRDRMVTPCDHFFHQECLEQWLNVKLECAVCRQTVPPC